MNYVPNEEKVECPFNAKCFRKNPIHFLEMRHPYFEKLLDGQLEQTKINLPSDLDFECPDRSALLEQLKVLQIVLKKEESNGKSYDDDKKTPQPQKRYFDEPSTSSDCKKMKEKSKSHSSSSSSLFHKFNSSSSQESRKKIRDSAISKMREAGHRIPHLGAMGEFDMKYAMSAPYHVFTPCIQRVKETYDQPFSITFSEILDISLGEIENSLHINFTVDVGWICLQYLFAGQKADSLILYGDRIDDSPLPTNIETVKITPPSKFGTHHSKISIIKYTNNGIRIIISTANLYSDDWENRTQMVWISPHLSPIEDKQHDGESPTGFKKDFIQYMKFYNLPKLSNWISLLENADFSPINVIFVASVPGSHQDNRWALNKVRSVLSKYIKLPDNSSEWSVIAQASSIGSLGPNYDSWLTQDLMAAMTAEVSNKLKQKPRFQFIYPSINNYKDSFDMMNGCCCLPYSGKTHMKQTWVENYMYQWKSDKKTRSKAMPHSKFYTRVSPDLQKVCWVILTSANLSKAAWGCRYSSKTTILNYEAGIIFLPSFVNNCSTFSIDKTDEKGYPPFLIPYDLPLTKYQSTDKAFVMEFFF